MHIPLEDFSMAYTDKGQGTHLLLVHGFPLTRQLWKPQIDSLSDKTRLLAPDLRGHGESSATPGPYTMDLLADDLNVFLDKIGITQPVVVCGLSMGGYVSFAFYSKFADRVAGLILTSTRAAADTPEGKQGRVEAAERIRKEGISAIVEGLLLKLMSPETYKKRPDLVSQVREIMEHVSKEAYLGDLMGMKERPDARSMLSQINVPTLIIHGADDQIVPSQEARTMLASIPGASMEIIPGVGHLPNLEKPEIFNHAVGQFLASFGG